MKSENYPTRSELIRRFTYDPAVGRLRYRFAVGRARTGNPVGHLHTGQLQAAFGGCRLQVARLVWIWHRGAVPQGRFVKTIDGDPLNVAIENLFLASHPTEKFEPLA